MSSRVAKQGLPTVKYSQRKMCENVRLDHSFYIYSVVEVNQNTQGTQTEFSDKSSQFYFQQSSSRLQTKPTQQRANTCFQDLVSQLFLMVASFSESYLKNNAAPLLTVSVKQQLVHAKAHTLLLVRNSFTSTVSPWSAVVIFQSPRSSSISYDTWTTILQL